jgi:hypothetical protein
MSNGTARRIAIALTLALSSVAGAPSTAAAVELQVRAPAALAALAGEVERAGPAALAAASELAGPDRTGLPILVAIEPEGSAVARATPPWISGFAQASVGRVVLFPSRVPAYPDRALEGLLTHEVAHVLVHRAAAGQPVPRWFDEGLAMAAAREGDLGDRARLAIAAISDDSLPLARVDRAFAGGETAAKGAYALARDVVHELIERHGRAAPAAILARVARGTTFRVAFRETTGVGLTEFEMEYWRRRTFWDRWLPIVTSSALLWGGISILAIGAFRRRRARDVARYLRWEEEEARAELAALQRGEPGAEEEEEQEEESSVQEEEEEEEDEKEEKDPRRERGGRDDLVN